MASGRAAERHGRAGGRLLFIVLIATLWCSAGAVTRAAEKPKAEAENAVVSCKLPARVHRVNRRVVYLAPRKIVALKTQDCLKRRGEIVYRRKGDDYDPHSS